jgi:hypothetical protein
MFVKVIGAEFIVAVAADAVFHSSSRRRSNALDATLVGVAIARGGQTSVISLFFDRSGPNFLVTIAARAFRADINALNSINCSRMDAIRRIVGGICIAMVSVVARGRRCHFFRSIR